MSLGSAWFIAAVALASTVAAQDEPVDTTSAGMIALYVTVAVVVIVCIVFIAVSIARGGCGHAHKFEPNDANKAKFSESEDKMRRAATMYKSRGNANSMHGGGSDVAVAAVVQIEQRDATSVAANADAGDDHPFGAYGISQSVPAREDSVEVTRTPVDATTPVPAVGDAAADASFVAPGDSETPGKKPKKEKKDKEGKKEKKDKKDKKKEKKEKRAKKERDAADDDDDDE
jgi:hypothetical protein